MTNRFRNSLGRWLALVGVVVFGILIFANQMMPFWFNVVFIVGCLVLLSMLPRAKKPTPSENAPDTTSRDADTR
jgi:hypothetical protein